jgi:hypothetical protein
LDKSDSLSNGDKVNYQWKITKDAVKNIKKKYNLTLKYKDFSDTVDGLKDLSEFDITDILEIKYSWYEPEAMMDVSSKIEDIQVSVDKEDDLSNGDEVTFTFTPIYHDSLEEACKENNIPTINEEYKYKLEDVPVCVKSISEIPENVRTMIKEAEESLGKSVIEDTASENLKVDDVSIVGVSLCQLEENKNAFLVFYTKHYYEPTDVTVYKCRAYKNVTNNENVDIIDDIITEDMGGHFSERGTPYLGYRTLEEAQEGARSFFDYDGPIELEEF